MNLIEYLRNLAKVVAPNRTAHGAPEASPSIPLQQAFSFEVCAIRRGDGGLFQPLNDANDRWARLSSAFVGIVSIEVLYELKTGEFLLVGSVSEDPRLRPHMAKGIVAHCSTPDWAIPVPIEHAAAFINSGQVPLKPRLLEALRQAEEKSRQPQPMTGQRPPSDWAGRDVLSLDRGLWAHETKALDALLEIRDAAIYAVQEIRGWANRPEAWRKYGSIFSLGLRLFDRYRVDPKKWKRSKVSVPPKHVDLLNLKWADGLQEMKKTVIPELRRLVEGPIGLLYENQFPNKGSDAATDEEKLAAEIALMGVLPYIEKHTVALSAVLDEIASGKMLKRLREEAPRPLRPPSDDELAAYVLKYVHKLTHSQIKTVLKLDITEQNVGRWAKKGRAWVSRGNPPPIEFSELSAYPGNTISLDPLLIDLGFNREGRTPRQRRKKTD